MEKPESPKSAGGQNQIREPSEAQTTHAKEAEALEAPVSGQAAHDKSFVPTKASHQYLAGFKLVLVLSMVTMAAFLILLDSAIIATAIPKITSEFHSIRDIGWYASAYLLSNCALQPFSGKLYTHLSSKYIFLAFLGVFELGSLLCAVSTSSAMLIGGRAVAGLGGSGLTNGALTIIAASVPLRKRPVILGSLMSIAQMGTVMGPLIGGALTQYTTWRWCFYINLPAGAVVALLLLAIHIPDRVTQDDKAPTLTGILHKLDLLGAVLFASAIVMFLLALEWGGQTYPWNSARVVGLIVGAFGMLSVFLAWEYRRGSTAIIPLTMLGNRVVYSSCLVQFFQMGTLIISTYYLAIWFQVVKGATPTLSGVYLLPSILSQMMFAIISGILVGHLGQYLPFSLASGMLLSIGSGLMTTLKLGTSTRMWIGFQVLAGSGRGCGLQMPLVAVQNTLSVSEAAIGTSLIVLSQYLGGALFSSAAETIFTSRLTSGLMTFAPKANAQDVIKAGASAVRAEFAGALLEGILLAYNEAVAYTFYLAMGAAIAIFVLCWGMGWKGLRKDKAAETQA